MTNENPDVWNAETARHSVPDGWPVNTATHRSSAHAASLDLGTGELVAWGRAEPARRPWTRFDTFVWRAAMIGAVIIAWAVIVAGVTLGITSARILSNLDRPSVSEQPLIGTDEPILPCEPDIEVC